MGVQESGDSIIYECVPNFSCAAGHETFPLLAEAAGSADVQLLNVQSDPWYNRTVLTFLGSPAQARAACFALVRAATAGIDMHAHRGAHPRLGAVDVFPFVPLRGASVSQCVDDVRAMAADLAEDLDLCVYLYGKAALRPERRRLADIRRGEFERWFQEIGRNRDRAPDFGRPLPRSCGPVVLGVRDILIAINFKICGADMALARKVARSVRSVNGGLPALQARAFLIGESPHVSCNILDYRRTLPRSAFEEILRRLRVGGADIEETELVGLIPRAALSREDIAAMRFASWEDSSYLDHWIGG